MLDTSRINNTMGKMAHYLNNHNSICVGVSGGSDSNIIVHIIATYMRQFLPKIHFVFCNTGLEYRATLRHLDYMEERYNIHIDRIRGESVVSVVRREGVPMVSKTFSHTVPQAMRNAPSAWKLINGEKMHNGIKSHFNFTPKQKELALHCINNNIKVSDKCCDLSKKKPMAKFEKEIQADLNISGERKAEGGARALRYTDCFNKGNNGKIDKFMPLYYWNDDTKEWYKQHEEIKYSDCYEVYGMKRTGCLGCPCTVNAKKELEIAKRFEPNVYNACMNVFGIAYKLMDKFDVHKTKFLDGLEQISFEEYFKGV